MFLGILPAISAFMLSFGAFLLFACFLEELGGAFWITSILLLSNGVCLAALLNLSNQFEDLFLAFISSDLMATQKGEERRNRSSLFSSPSDARESEISLDFLEKRKKRDPLKRSFSSKAEAVEEGFPSSARARKGIRELIQNLPIFGGGKQKEEAVETEPESFGNLAFLSPQNRKKKNFLVEEEDSFLSEEDSASVFSPGGSFSTEKRFGKLSSHSFGKEKLADVLPIREGVVVGIPFRVYPDGTIEADFPAEAKRRFKNVRNFRAYIEDSQASS